MYSAIQTMREIVQKFYYDFLHSVPTKYTALGGGSVLQFSQVVCLLFRCGALAWQSLSISLAAEREMAKWWAF